MAKVRLLVGTHKGAFVLTSDERRRDWKVDGPHFTGWDVYHLKGSPADPDRLYAAQSRGWFGQVAQRSDDGGATWEPVSNEFRYEGATNTHKWYDNTDHPYEFLRVWHLEPSLTDPDTVYAGVEDAALFRTTDAGKSWEELPALRTHPSASTWAPGAGGLCLHTIILDKDHPDRIVTAISSAGAFRSDDAGKTWKTITKGLHSHYIPDPDAEVGHCVHHIAMHPRPPHRRHRMGAAHQRPASEGLLRERAARCDVDRLARFVRCLLRHHRRHGLRIRGRRRQLDGDRGKPACGALGGGTDLFVIRVELPSNLRTLANVGREVELKVDGPVTQRSVLDALEAAYPMLRGTIRDQITWKRRAMLRFFACEEDLSDESIDAPLPDEVATGREPYLIVGAIAGG